MVLSGRVISDSLSPEALGVYVRLLYFSIDSPTQAVISEIANCGAAKARRIQRELRDAGYIELTQHRLESGAFGGIKVDFKPASTEAAVH